MAFTARLIDAPADVVFGVLVEPETYPHWLIGAEAIRSVDDGWPAVGSRFHHRVGVGRFTIPDSTAVLEVDAPELLALLVRARPFVSAVARFEVHPTDDGQCIVTLEEEPTLRTLGNLVRPLLDPLVHLRNHRSLLRLSEVVSARPRPPA